MHSTFTMAAEIKKSNNSIMRLLLIWFAVNTVIGILIGSIIFANSSMPAWQVFFFSLFNTHIISSLTASAGYYFGYKFKNKPALQAILYTLIGVYPATLVGIALCTVTYYLIQNSYSDIFLKERITGFILPILILTAVITIITSVIERLIMNKNELEHRIKSREINDLQDNRKKSAEISVKEKENHFLVSTSAIIYLSSHGKKTIIHTEKKDYETSQLIKELEEKLDPDTFIRVHKQFIVNTDFISSIQSYTGGRYLAYLKDNDSNTIPVGRTYVQRLKTKLNI